MEEIRLHSFCCCMIILILAARINNWRSDAILRKHYDVGLHDGIGFEIEADRIIRTTYWIGDFCVNPFGKVRSSFKKRKGK